MAIYNRNEFEKLKRKVSRANKAIERIEKQYGEDSWGVNRLYNKLDNELVKGITKTGKIRLNKNMTDIQLRAIEKATENFLGNKKTSTLTGIKGTIKEVKSTLKATYGDMGNKLTNKEVNKLYDLVADKDKRIITEQLGASDVWATMVEAKELGMNKNEFVDLMSRRTQADINDVDTLEFLDDIYNSYMS